MLEEIIDSIQMHDVAYPEHGIGCSCMDEHARKIRQLIYEKELKGKSMQNFQRVLFYIVRA